MEKGIFIEESEEYPSQSQIHQWITLSTLRSDHTAGVRSLFGNESEVESDEVSLIESVPI